MKKYLFKQNNYLLETALISVLLVFTNLSTAAAVESCLTPTKTTDVAGHSCCILPPPDKISVDIDANDVSFSTTGSNTWLPLSGSIDSSGSITLQGISTVAGFSDVTTTFTGSQDGNTISGTFTVGASGKLPQSQPIIYDVSIDTACGSSSGCAGTYQDASMEIILDTDLSGTVTSAGLEGKLYGVNEYDTVGNVCFVSAFVTLSQGASCDLAVAGRLEVKTLDGAKQGQFDFGGGNSCSGVIAPFSITLPKVK